MLVACMLLQQEQSSKHTLTLYVRVNNGALLDCQSLTQHLCIYHQQHALDRGLGWGGWYRASGELATPACCVSRRLRSRLLARALPTLRSRGGLSQDARVTLW